ncbi:MAG: shikimate dehydrogenase [Planktomarina sp.]|nr:shikimate dehydrogenase [Planktomarina sp.]
MQFLKQHDRSIVGKTPKIAAVLGSPISHSKSPIMHRHWLKKNKIAGDYIAIDVSKEKFSQTVKVLADVGVSGFNVTLPHKEAALTLADSHTEQAKKIGAANTLFVDVNGAIKADNTDGYGFMANLKANNANWLPSAGSAMVLGAGGAARAILVSLLEAGVPKIYLSNRTMATSQKLADHFSPKIEVIDWEKKDTCLSNISLLVNTTSLGMAGKPPLNINLSSLAKKALVTDLVYAPIKTPLLIQAEEMGCDIVTGVGMLIHQGVPGFNGWFGILPKVDNEITELVTR